jgi:hypothetical protein
MFGHLFKFCVLLYYFVVHFKTMLVNIWHSVVSMVALMDGELQRIWKEAIVV